MNSNLQIALETKASLKKLAYQMSLVYRVAQRHMASLGAGYSPTGMIGEQFNLLVYSQALAAAFGIKGPHDSIYKNPRGAWSTIRRAVKDYPEAAGMDPAWLDPQAFNMYRVLFDKVRFLRIPDETKGEILNNCLAGLGTDYERIPAIGDDGKPIVIQKRMPDGKIEMIPQMIESSKPSLRKPVMYEAASYPNVKQGILNGSKSPEDVAKLAASFAQNRGMDVLRGLQKAKARFQHTVGDAGEHLELDNAVGDVGVRSFEGVDEAAQTPEGATALVQVLRNLPGRSKAMLFDSLEDYIRAHFDDVGLDRVKLSDPLRGRDLAIGYVKALLSAQQEPGWNAIKANMPEVDAEYEQIMQSEGKPSRETNIHPNDWTRAQDPMKKLFQSWVLKNQRAIEFATQRYGLSNI